MQRGTRRGNAFLQPAGEEPTLSDGTTRVRWRAILVTSDHLDFPPDDARVVLNFRGKDYPALVVASRASTGEPVIVNDNTPRRGRTEIELVGVSEVPS